jgi:protein-tyrosine phosphatase
MTDNSTIWWVKTNTPGKLGLVPRPRGGDWLADDVAAWRRAGITTVVSMLMPEEEAELDLQGERAACLAAGLDFISVATSDRGTPDLTHELRGLVTKLSQNMYNGTDNIVVHCRQSVGRAALMVALIMARFGGAPGATITAIGYARGRDVPDTEEQRVWLGSVWPAR